MLVLWSGVCGGAVAEMEKMEGLSLVAGLERKKIRKMGVTAWFRREKKLGFGFFFSVVALNFSLKKYCSL